jgi:protein-tyrosine phosphatase
LTTDDGPCRYGQPSSVVKVCNSKLEILREGVVATGTLQRLSSVMVLMVCTGNTCRSPMAELLMRQRMAKHKKCRPEDLEDIGFVVRSAGLAAGTGGPPAPEAVSIMHEHGMDLTGHETQPLTEQMVRHADLILAMTNGHLTSIVSRWPEAADRAMLLLPDENDVPDPIGSPVDAYRRCAELLKVGVEHHAQRIHQQCSRSKSEA